jgi:hypothetical protein
MPSATSSMTSVPPAAPLIQGIYQATSENVENNFVSNVSGYGIHLWHDANHVNIVNNTVSHNGRGGILVGGGDFHTSSGPDDYDVVANNVVYGNANSGIAEWGSTGTHNLYTNNASYGNAGSYGDWYLQNGNTHTDDVDATAMSQLVQAMATFNPTPSFASPISEGTEHLLTPPPTVAAASHS